MPLTVYGFSVLTVVPAAFCHSTKLAPTAGVAEKTTEEPYKASLTETFVLPRVASFDAADTLRYSRISILSI